MHVYSKRRCSGESLSALPQKAINEGEILRSNFLPSISYWFFGTITGITGGMLVATMSVIYVFSAPAVMKRAYHAFRITHLLNVLLYALTILHGLPKLLDVRRRKSWAVYNVFAITGV